MVDIFSKMLDTQTDEQREKLTPSAGGGDIEAESPTIVQVNTFFLKMLQQIPDFGVKKMTEWRILKVPEEPVERPEALPSAHDGEEWFESKTTFEVGVIFTLKAT